MKSTCLILMALVMLSTGCKQLSNLWKDDSIAVSVIADGTSPLVRNPDTSEIIRLMHLTDDSRLYSGMFLRYRCISDVALTPVQTLKVPPVSMMLSNDVARVEELKTFKQNLRKIFEEGQRGGLVPQTRSCIYEVLISEANALMKIKAAEHYLIVYSDMLDFDKNLNMYSQVVRDQVRAHPFEVLTSLRKVATLGNMTNLRVIIVYQSRNNDADKEEMVRISSRFYQYIFTMAGATCVTVPSVEVANLNEAQ